MNKILFTLLSVLIFSAAYAQEKIIARNPTVITGRLVKVTGELRNYKLSDKAIPDVIVRDLDGIVGKDEAFEEGVERPRYPASKTFKSDPALQKLYPVNVQANVANRAIVQNFAGMPYQPLNPPDPSLCVGPNHVIQMINGSSGALFKVYNKTGGQVVAQTYLDAITGKGGLGDPIAIYDQLADRFILTEFNNKPETGTEGLTMAVSKTNDPAGQWYVYFFSTGNTFPDYPKFSVWNDAYYATTNDFANGSTYAGSTVYAFDRTKMLAGDATATVQKFTLGSTDKFFSMSPVNLEGSVVPPAGSGGLIAYMQDDTWTASSTDVDSIGLLEFNVDFTTPANTTIKYKVTLATLAFKSDLCTATRGQCISQPPMQGTTGTTVKLEGLDSKIMNQPIYRRFGGYEGIVLTHLVDKGSSIAGARWYELRKTSGNWGIYQQSTYAPDNTHRWLPSICYDNGGNIGLAYNVSSSATGVYPGARYTGRKECDPLNAMSYAENVLIAGTAPSSSTRYGDYNHLVCDPDGVTFWFTCEYNVASTWSTQIASFTLDPCTPVACGDPASLASSAITNTSATVGWGAVANAVSYDVDYKAASSATWINAATATAATSINLSSLTQGTLYNWRVRATCAAGSGNYVAAQFTTTAPVVCGVPTGLVSSAITSSGAQLAWGAVSSATSYDVDYKLTSSATWINAATATAATSTTLTGLSASASYDWRVRANCSSGSGNYAAAQFSTIAQGCTDQLEPNNTAATAAPITVGVTYNALIAVNGDNDYYAFNNTPTLKKIRVSLTNLPVDYDMKLYRPSGALTATSQNGGTASEQIIYNASKNNDIGTYKVYVYGYSGTFSSTQCYTLLVELGANNFSSTSAQTNQSNAVQVVRSGLKVYPNPASGTFTVSFDAYKKGTATISLFNQVGQQISDRKVSVENGINFNSLDASRLKAGVYFIKVNNGNGVQTQKIIISR